MPVYKATLLMGLNGDGASETYWTGNIAATAAHAQLENFFNTRATLLPFQSYIQGLRISRDDGTRASQVIKPPTGVWNESGIPFNLPPGGSFPLTGAGNLPSQWRQVLQVNFGLSNGVVKPRYISGVPRALIGPEPGTYIPGGNPAWDALMLALINILKGGSWFVPTLTKPSPLDPFIIQAFAPALTTGGDIGIVGPTSGFTGMTAGTVVHVYGVRARKFTRFPTINGVWSVSATGTEAGTGRPILYLRGSVLVDPATQRLTTRSYVVPVKKGYSSITSGTIQGGVVHKRGKPGLTPRGRRLSRPTLDP
jgi:hypothetical protein